MPDPQTQVNEKLDRIRQRIALSVPVGVAITIELGGSIPKWAAAISLRMGGEAISRVDASMTINGVRKPLPRVVAALVEELGCTDMEILEVLGEGAKQRA